MLKGALYGCLYSHNTDVAQLVESTGLQNQVSGVRISPSVQRINYMAGIRTYVEEIVNELSNKVSWPTWEELQTSSVIVLVTSIILALIIWLMDYAFGIWSVPEGEWGWKGILGFIYELIQ